MNFIVTGATYLRYFFPLIIEGNKRGIQSRLFLQKSAKYNSCFLPRAQKEINSFSRENNVEIHRIDDIRDHPGNTFLVEGDGLSYLTNKHFKINLTYMTDFSLLYRGYIDKIDLSIMTSKYFSKKYNTCSVKNAYFGSPKYDVLIDENDVLKKYNIKSKKNALVIFPRSRDAGKIDISKIYDLLESLGYNLLIKTRGKDPIPESLKRGQCFSDDSWFPHTTQELLAVSDIAINFSSTSIKECILMKVPVINFNIKPFDLIMSELYSFDFCKKFDCNIDNDLLELAIAELTNKNLNDDFDRAIKEYLFKPGNVSTLILDKMLGVKKR